MDASISVFACLCGASEAAVLRIEVGGLSEALAAALTGKDWLLFLEWSANLFLDGLAARLVEDEAWSDVAVVGGESKAV